MTGIFDSAAINGAGVFDSAALVESPPVEGLALLAADDYRHGDPCPLTVQGIDEQEPYSVYVSPAGEPNTHDDAEELTVTGDDLEDGDGAATVTADRATSRYGQNVRLTLVQGEDSDWIEVELLAPEGHVWWPVTHINPDHQPQYLPAGREAEDFDTTDGSGEYDGSLPFGELLPGSWEITVGAATFSDDGEGNLSDGNGGTGTLNYETGALTLDGAPANEDISAVGRILWREGDAPAARNLTTDPPNGFTAADHLLPSATGEPDAQAHADLLAWLQEDDERSAQYELEWWREGEGWSTTGVQTLQAAPEPVVAELETARTSVRANALEAVAGAAATLETARTAVRAGALNPQTGSVATLETARTAVRAGTLSAETGAVADLGTARTSVRAGGIQPSTGVVVHLDTARTAVRANPLEAQSGAVAVLDTARTAVRTGALQGFTGVVVQFSTARTRVRGNAIQATAGVERFVRRLVRDVDIPSGLSALSREVVEVVQGEALEMDFRISYEGEPVNLVGYTVEAGIAPNTKVPYSEILDTEVILPNTVRLILPSELTAGVKVIKNYSAWVTFGAESTLVARGAITLVKDSRAA